MASYLLDTNHASRLMAQEEPMASRVRQAAAGGDQFGISVTVLGELYFAAYASHRREQNLSRLQALSNTLIIWPFDESAAQTFGRIQAEQKAAGHPVPPLDTQIAAVARVHGLTVLTADHHFQLIPGLNIENWV